MRSISVLLGKDFALFRRDRGRVVLTFLVPLVMIYLFGQVFGVNRRDPGPEAISLAVVDASGSPEGSRLIAALRAETAFRIVTTVGQGSDAKRPMTVPDLRPMIQRGQYRFAVVIPPVTATGAVTAGIRVTLLGDPRNETERRTLTGLIERALAGDALSRLVYVDEEKVAAIQNRRSPMATQLVGGWAMQFLLFALVASSTSLFEERDRGLFQRILSGPVSPSAILWSKFLYGVGLGLCQLAILFLAGRALFGIEILRYIPQLTVVCLCAAAACSAFGMLLAAFASTSETAQALSAFCILLMSALGGAWFPIGFMPEFMQHVSRFTLVYWSITGFRQVLWEHAPAVELVPTIGILAGTTAALLALAWWRFNRGRVFE